MKFYIISGEASGDLHGSNLIRALKKKNPIAEFRAWGGDQMQAAGAEIIKNYRDLAFMGFWEVAKNIFKILGNLAFAKRDILDHRPDVLILIDYPGFNLRIAKWAKTQGLRVVYYISPQIWAWKESRAKAIARDVDLMISILPFEPAFYQKHGIEAHFVGHPLLDLVKEQRRAPITDPDFAKKVVALLPGSREQEVKRMLPIMLDMARQYPEFRYVVAGTPSLGEDFYKAFMTVRKGQVSLVMGKMHDVLRLADAALVTSGTATLETALLGVPQVVCYKTSAASFAIAKRLVKTRFISLVNLILEEKLVDELIQNDLTNETLGDALGKLMTEKEQLRIISGYEKLRERLGETGASERAADLILKN